MSQGHRSSKKGLKKQEIVSNLKQSRSFRTGYLTLTNDQDIYQKLAPLLSPLLKKDVPTREK